MSAAPAVKLEAKQKAVEADVKEVSMDVSAPAMEGGGGGKTRRRRAGSRRRRQRGGAEGQPKEDQPSTVGVEKEEGDRIGPEQNSSSIPPVHTTATPINTTTKPNTSQKPQGGGAKPLVIIAPPKKKAPKVTLVPKAAGKRAPVKKTFKAKRVRVLIKNRKTVKRQQQMLQKVDTMTDVQVRESAAAAGLTRKDANAPVELLRTMLRDYHTMKGGFL
jgi:hypothetical protein